MLQLQPSEHWFCWCLVLLASGSEVELFVWSSVEDLWRSRYENVMILLKIPSGHAYKVLFVRKGEFCDTLDNSDTLGGTFKMYI